MSSKTGKNFKKILLKAFAEHDDEVRHLEMEGQRQVAHLVTANNLKDEAEKRLGEKEQEIAELKEKHEKELARAYCGPDSGASEDLKELVSSLTFQLEEKDSEVKSLLQKIQELEQELLKSKRVKSADSKDKNKNSKAKSTTTWISSALAGASEAAAEPASLTPALGSSSSKKGTPSTAPPKSGSSQDKATPVNTNRYLKKHVSKASTPTRKLKAASTTAPRSRVDAKPEGTSSGTLKTTVVRKRKSGQSGKLNKSSSVPRSFISKLSAVPTKPPGSAPPIKRWRRCCLDNPCSSPSVGITFQKRTTPNSNSRPKIKSASSTPQGASTSSRDKPSSLKTKRPDDLMN